MPPTLKPLADSLFQKLDSNTQLLMRRSGVVPVLDPILPLWNLPEGTRTVVLIGGRGGAKTYGVSDFIAYSAAVNRKRCVVLRDEKSKIKGSILNEILLRYDDIPFHTNTERQETGLKYDKVQPNGSKVGYDIVFTMGFRASENAKTATMKGISDIDIAIIEEAEDIRDVEKYNQFTDGLRKEGCLVIIILNTPDIGHWILKRFFNCNVPVTVPEGADAKDYDGYFEVEPKAIDGFVCISTSYENNNKLPAAKIDEYKAYGDRSSHLYNLHHYLTAIKGYASTGRKGQVLKKVKPISLADYMALPYREFYGQDFGTASPAGMVGVKFDKNNCYCREMNYEPMTPIAIGRKYCTLNFGPRDKIICDSADKYACDMLDNGWFAGDLSEDDRRNYPGLIKGFFIDRCHKGDGSIRAGIGIMEGLNLFAVAESSNLWEEIRNYVYDVDKNGNFLNDPIDGYNHCFTGDAMITTLTIPKRIDSVSVGDFVLTSVGYKKIVHVFNNGCRAICNYIITFGDNQKIILKCTPDHKIKTIKGWISISSLQPGQTVYCNNPLMGEYSGYIQRKSIFPAAIKGCIDMYGSFLMGKLKELATFIIKMRTHITTCLVILNRLIPLSIAGYTEGKNTSTRSGPKNSSRQDSWPQLNGTHHQLGGSGIKNRLKRFLTLSNQNNSSVCSAGKCLCTDQYINQNSAPTIVNHNTVELLEQITLQENAKYAVESFQLTSTQKQSIAVENVVVSVQVLSIEKPQLVYDLMVEDEHEYFANGLLVHNCIDPWRYVCEDQRGKKEMFGV